jgi:DNA-binding transcriptional MocR family regulator
MSTHYAYRQIENWLHEQLDKKRWKPGERLPSVRQLCHEKSLSKATVLHALQRLEASGKVEARPRSGYYAAYPPITQQYFPQTKSVQEPFPKPVNVSELFSDLMQRGAAFDLFPDAQVSEALDPGLLQLNRCLGRALRQQPESFHHQYDEPAGYFPLRQQLALRYQRDGCPVDAEALCITSGCQHSLYLALQATCQKGDLVAVESPGFYGVLQLLEQLELQALEIPSSPTEGLDLNWLEHVAQKWPIRACVVTPAFATPTGATLPSENQKQLLQLASHFDFTIIEDDIYRELGFYSRPTPLLAHDWENRVILCGSFSKSLSRDLRIGWIYGGALQSSIVKHKLIMQLSSCRYVQQGLSDFIEEGQLDRHFRQHRQRLKHQSDILAHSLESFWPEEVRFTRPAGGLCLWAEWQRSFNAVKLYQTALKHNIVVTPGPLFSASGLFQQSLRLSFSRPWTAERLEALVKLKQLIDSQ